jgi:hypothetical protein
MGDSAWRLYIGKIPHDPKENYWVSFESDPKLQKSKGNIYGRCLPCIHNLYEQLKEGKKEINLGPAFNCWKITAIVQNIEEAMALLNEFEKRFPTGHVHGKFGSGRTDVETKVVVFQAYNEVERDRLKNAVEVCLKSMNSNAPVQLTRACGILYHELLGDSLKWQPITPIKHPEKAAELLEKIKVLLYRSAM